MTKPDLDHILNRLKAKANGQPLPAKPASVQHLAPAAKGQALPWADVVPPETEWERAYRRAQELPKLQVNGRGLNLNQPYTYRGPVGPIQKLSTLPKEEQSPDSLRVTQAKAALDAPYRGTSQERIALHNALANAKRGRKLTHAEKHIMGKWRLAIILARLPSKGVSNG